MGCIYGFSIAFLSCLLLTFLFRLVSCKVKVFKKLNLIIEKNDRFVPVIGGLSIYICFFISILFYIKFFNNEVKDLNLLCSMVIGGGCFLILGILDDIFELSPLSKLGGQILIGVIVVLLGRSTDIIYVPQSINLVITVIWIVGIVNAFNFLDILDGLAPGIALVSSFIFFLLGIYTNNTLMVVICLFLVGVLLAFLIFNFPPATMYLGDMGSMVIGFLLSIIAFEISYAPKGHEFALISPILILGLPIYDFLFVTFRRIINKKSILKKSNDHFAFQLIKRGYSHKKTLYTLYGLSILFGITAICITLFENKISFYIFLFFIIIFIGLNIVLFTLRQKKLKNYSI